MTGLPESTVQTVGNRFGAYLQAARTQIAAAEPIAVCGRLTRVAGLVMEAVGLRLPVGSTCTIVQDHGPRLVHASPVP